MSKESFSKKTQRQRESIAQLAARLIAGEGIQDFGLAKRKAARQHGVQDKEFLPSNKEIEAALKIYHALYQKDEHAERLSRLRSEALRFMRLLEPFHPYLVGAVLSGAAGRYADINLHLYTDSSKAVELFFLNRQILYKAGEQQLRLNSALRNVPSFILTGESAAVEIAVLKPTDLHSIPQNQNEAPQPERASIKQVEALMQQGPR